MNNYFLYEEDGKIKLYKIMKATALKINLKIMNL